VILLIQLAMSLLIFYAGFSLLVWPLTAGITAAFSTAGPALWTFGSADAHGFYEKALLDSAAMAGLVTVTLQIAYLPHLYAAFNRRENEIALLNSRAGSPSWGPELHRGARNSWPGPTTRWARATRPWTRCPRCTGTGNAGPPTSPRVTSPTRRWCSSARPIRWPRGSPRC
jgi:hypothetical protein